MNYAERFIADRNRWQRVIEDIACEIALYPDENGKVAQTDISPLISGFNQVWQSIVASQLDGEKD